ncbi:ATP-dependent endonuclease [Methylocystis sp.]|uniref:ATP-dependent nuclease n=1 Tax=Methylocystis sp. TaxID=1911079 RepID=UPI00273670F0|nr:AAA family ATPase [Methylocystis sp.]MDP3553802.1 AAA family ATPase [Methylocystis sp.]
MIEQPITFALPKPWAEQDFTLERFGELSFLVGPNGSGKSRFADTLKYVLPNARLLGTDRLEGMARSALASFIGDRFEGGYEKSNFSYFRHAGSVGSGIDAFIILEERPDIRVIVEATLSSLFNRDITLEWDSGNLVPKARLARTGDSYRMDREECHGIRELLVLLTHLHNDEHAFLIIDEPELNLHPQFQSFFIQEARKIAGPHITGTSRKGVLLITHSPFILDLRTIDDMQSVFCFSADHSPPRFIGSLPKAESDRLVSLIPRLNVHHKQLFFADNPIFVEGISDAQLIEAIQERRKASITAAGSCLIDVGGCEEATKYVELCRHYGKEAYFLFDLDSLFLGSLRQCVREDGIIVEFLADLGLGADFASYCGALDRELTTAVKAIESAANAQGVLAALQTYFGTLLQDTKKLARQRVAVLVEVAANHNALLPVLNGQQIACIEGRLRQVKAALQKKHIFLLGGGALEHYLPSYAGERYALNDGSKKNAVLAEVALLATGTIDDVLADRYGELFKCIEALPAKPPVDTESVLRGYVSSYIHDLQGLVVSKASWSKEQIVAHFKSSQPGLGKLITLVEFETPREGEFRAVLKIAGPQGYLVDVSHETNAGMRRFTFRSETAVRGEAAS